MIHYPGHANTVDQAARRLAAPQLAATTPQYRNAAAATTGDVFLATIRQSVYSRSLPLATRDLRIVRSSNIETIGLQGAAFVVLDELFSRAIWASGPMRAARLAGWT
jgi:hypothetical protein